MRSHSKSARRGLRRSARARGALALAAALLGALALMPFARAQGSAPQIAVVHTATQEQENRSSLPLSIFFTLRDPQTNEIVPRSAVSLDGAQGQLTVKSVGGQSFPSVPVSVTTPQTPIKIALVIDRSGSMNQTVSTAAGEQRTLDAIVRDAAVESIKSAPPQAELAVFSFAERTEPQSDGFLRRADQSQLIEDSIRRFTTNPSGTGNTCISDAALQAIQTLNDASDGTGVERKAVILFTDGLDKEANREGNPNNCSNADFASVINNAKLSASTIIPIYTIWPCDPCDENQRVGLENLARETNGKAAIGSLQEVGSLFQQVMDLLNSQWLVQADVNAVEGENTALLELTLDGGGTLTAAPVFEAPYSTVQAPEIRIAEQRYDEENDRYIVSLRVANPQAVGQLSASVYTQETGGLIVGQAQNFDSPQEQFSFELPTAGMEANRNYFLRISATGADGQPLRDAEGNPLLLSYPFTYEPSLSYTIGAVRPEWDDGPLVVEVNVRGAGQRELSFSGEIVNRNGGARESLELTTLRDGLLRFPMPPMLRQARESGASSEYEIVLRLENGPNTIERRTEQPVTLTPPEPEAPNLLPFVLAGLGVVLVGVVGGLLFLRSRPRKQEIPLPYNSATMLSAQEKPAPPKADPPATPAPPGPAAAPPPARPSPVVKVSPVARPPVSDAALTELQSARPPAAPTIIHAESEATVLHTDEAPRPRARLKVLQTVDGAQVREQTVDLPCSLGREGTTFTITGDPKISRRHAELRLDGDRLLLADLGSTNGTFVRETRLERDGAAPLESPTVIGVGPNTRLEVELV